MLNEPISANIKADATVIGIPVARPATITSMEVAMLIPIIYGMDFLRSIMPKTARGTNKLRATLELAIRITIPKPIRNDFHGELKCLLIMDLA